jgi:hypothetical protein
MSLECLAFQLWRSRPVSSQLAHHRAGSQGMLPRRPRGWLARQMSRMIWNGIHRSAMGMSHPQNAQPRARRWGQSDRSALALAR